MLFAARVCADAADAVKNQTAVALELLHQDVVFNSAATEHATFDERRPAVEHASMTSGHVADVGCGSVDRGNRHAT